MNQKRIRENDFMVIVRLMQKIKIMHNISFEKE
jgi:hypothetical protein